MITATPAQRHFRGASSAQGPEGRPLQGPPPGGPQGQPFMQRGPPEAPPSQSAAAWTPLGSRTPSGGSLGDASGVQPPAALPTTVVASAKASPVPPLPLGSVFDHHRQPHEQMHMQHAEEASGRLRSSRGGGALRDEAAVKVSRRESAASSFADRLQEEQPPSLVQPPQPPQPPLQAQQLPFRGEHAPAFGDS
ncbi:hypothetical protein cyc_09324 [Cyclospora cayetanensis]|uniref:Uncharacterized protein n=1 Tax=Cyclospora cayetanensis TaxID=88456 RepID=A0A1D3CRP7_9EIME|nr:hypothetical protein cyc_09324 [Cyclospora cayetanensis]